MAHGYGHGNGHGHGLRHGLKTRTNKNKKKMNFGSIKNTLILKKIVNISFNGRIIY